MIERKVEISVTTAKNQTDAEKESPDQRRSVGTTVSISRSHVGELDSVIHPYFFRGTKQPLNFLSGVGGLTALASARVEGVSGGWWRLTLPPVRISLVLALTHTNATPTTHPCCEKFFTRFSRELENYKFLVAHTTFL